MDHVGSIGSSNESTRITRNTDDTERPAESSCAGVMQSKVSNPVIFSVDVCRVACGNVSSEKAAGDVETGLDIVVQSYSGVAKLMEERERGEDRNNSASISF